MSGLPSATVIFGAGGHGGGVPQADITCARSVGLTDMEGGWRIVYSTGAMPFRASKCPIKRASFAVTVYPSLYLSELHSKVASLTLVSRVLRSGAVNAGFIGSTSVAADAMASLH